MSASNAALSHLFFHEDGEPIFSPCIEIAGICGIPLAAAAGGYLHAYEVLQKEHGEAFEWWRTNAMKTMRPWDNAAASMLPFWLEDDTSLHAPMVGLTVQAGPIKPACSPPVLEFYHEHLDPEHPRGGIRFGLPVERADAPDQLFELACDAFAELPLTYGWAGYALAWHLDSERNQELARGFIPPLLRRHPGLATGDMMPAVLSQHTGMITMGWLTFVGPAMLERLGGRDTVLGKLGATASSRELASGALVLRASLAPMLGDVNRQEALAEYRDVGRILETVRASDEIMARINLMFIDGERKVEWLMRFFAE
ncbi:MAG: DUF3396 domain-containing protein [Myxococcales bacterium]|nr:DUF3396 domain-containing protein [Myxococcales bacterium]